MKSLNVKLEEPGAGLPKCQGLFLRYLGMPLLFSVISWQRAFDIYEREAQKIIDTAKQLSPEELNLPVLVAPMSGIEDSSRCWSVSQAIWHLRFVSEHIQKLMIALSHGQKVDLVVRIADVKPPVSVDANEHEMFERFVKRFRKETELHVADRYARSCHVHPWFGCLRPYQWAVMCMIHIVVHRRQVEAICNKLSKEMP